MRILYVALTPPFPPNNGHRMHNWHLVNALALEGHAISVACFAGPEDGSFDLAPLAKVCESVKVIPSRAQKMSRWAEALGRGRAMFSTLPYGVFKYESPEMQRAILALLRERGFDAIVCDDIYLYKNLPPHERARALLDKHDFTFVIVRCLLDQIHNPLKWAYGWLEYLKLRRWEARVSSSVARVHLVSEQDGKVLRQLAPSARMNIVPNVMDADEYIPQTEDQNGPLLFVGAMDYHANQDAVKFFVSQILPEIRKHFPGIQFVIAGRNPPESLRRRVAGISNVIFTGSVPDMRTEIAKSLVCVVPLRIGSGVRLKILEAAAMARPVVSTRIGAEGLDFVSGKEILLADEPKEFAEAVATLLKDTALRESMGQAARRRVERQYSIEALRVALRDALSSLAVSKDQGRQEGSSA